MFTRSGKTGSILVAAAALALSTAGCSSSGSNVAASTSSTSSSSAAAAGGTTSSPASQSAASSSSATSASTSASDSGASASDSASPSSGPTGPAITNKTSDWVERNGFKIKVDSVTYPYVPAPGQGGKPGPNESMLKLRIEVVNTGKDSATFTPGDADIRDGGNRSFVFDIVDSDALPVHFELKSLKPGEKQVGDAVFSGPSGAKGLRLVFLSQLMARDGSGVATGPKPVVDLGV